MLVVPPQQSFSYLLLTELRVLSSSPLRACLFTRWKSHKTTHLRDKLQPTPILPDLAHLAHRAHRALVLGLVLAAIKGAGLEGATAVDGCVGGSADVELGELVELDFVRVVGAALARGFDLLGLMREKS